jgi:hypothetical protein
MAPSFSCSSYALNLDETLIGIEGEWGEQMGLVHQDSDSGTPELTIPFFRLPEFHQGNVITTGHITSNISHSLRGATSNLPQIWENGSAILRHSYTDGFNYGGAQQADNFVGWELSPTQFGSVGSWNDNSVFTSADEGQSPVAIDIFHNTGGSDFGSDLLHPNSASNGWMEFSPAMSRAESVASVASFDTAFEEPFDIAMEPVSPDSEQFGPMEGSFEPSPQSQLNVVPMQMDLRTNRMKEKTAPGKKPAKGRKGPLKPRTKEGAARMRKIKACDSCRRRKTQVGQPLIYLAVTNTYTSATITVAPANHVYITTSTISFTPHAEVNSFRILRTLYLAVTPSLLVGPSRTT